MHITGGKLQAQSQHSFNRSETQISVRLQQGAAPTAPAPQPVRPALPAAIPAIPAGQASAADCEDTGYDKELSLLKLLVESLSGKQINTLSANNDPAPAQPVRAPSAAPTGGNVLRVDALQISETEITQVAFTGQFSTADGTQISLSLHYSLERHYSATRISASFGNANATDPLILNFNGLGVALDPQRTEFDLNSDGTMEAIPTLRAGSSYLAFDRNNDGAINNGSELFGPTSGSSYGELAAFDSDGNGFIDEADPVFSQLLLFRPGEATQTLASRDVGAIFLGSAASPARLTDSNNQSLGQLRATGFYLTNAGGAGLVQELDLVV